MYRIGYYSYYEKPWSGLARKMWEHHDSIFELLGKIHDIEIHPIFHPGSVTKVEKYYNGDTDLLVRGFRDIPFVFHDFDDYYKNFDALFLETGHICRFEHMYKSISKEEEDKSVNYLISIITDALRRDIPIVWYDGDAELINDKVNGFSKYLFYEVFNDISRYDNVTIIGPYEEGLNRLKHFKFVPYNINFDRLNDISKRDSDTKYLSTYFGSNFKRANFGDILLKLSNYGNVRVFGSGWNSHIKKDIDNKIEWNNGLWLSCEEFKKYYDESLFGIYGTARSHYAFKHYTLRIVEYLYSGIYIVPDNKEYILNKFPDGQFNISDLDNEKYTNDFIDSLRSNYIDIVSKQREILRSTFDSYNYYNIYENSLYL